MMVIVSMGAVAWAGVAGVSSSGGSPACTYATVKSAIQAAPAGATVYVLPGTYVENWGTLVGKNVVIRPGSGKCGGPGAGRVTIDAGSSARLVNALGGSWTLVNIDVVNGSTTSNGGQFALTNADLVLDNATLTHGAGASGGAIYASGGDVTLTNGAAIRDATATGSGGAVYIELGTLSVLGSSVIEGSDAGIDGGGVRGGDDATVVVEGAITGNTAVGSGGGVWSSGTVTLAGGSAIDGNVAVDGAGIGCVSCAVLADGASVSANVASGTGGGIHADHDSYVELVDSDLGGNWATVLAGGVYSEALATRITGGTVSGNETPGSGGGVYCDDCDLEVTDVTVTGNEAGVGIVPPTMQAACTFCGGGIAVFADAPGASAVLIGGTLDGNTAIAGGGLMLFNADATLTGTVVTSNLARGLTDGGGVNVGLNSSMLACGLTTWGSGTTDNAPEDVKQYAFSPNSYAWPGAQDADCSYASGVCVTAGVVCP